MIINWGRPSTLRSESESARPVAVNGERLRIVHTVSSLHVGGMEQFAIRLAALQREKGHDVAILSLCGGKLEETARALGVPLIVTRTGAKPIRILRAAAFLAGFHPAIIHVHNPTSLHYAVMGKYLSGARVVLTDHGQSGGRPRLPSTWEMRNTDAIVCVSSDAAKRHAPTFVGGPLPKVILNGVDRCTPARSRESVRAELSLPAGPTGIVVARLEPIKDHQTLLHALSLLSNRRPDINLLIVGDGSERDRLQQMLPGLGLDAERVRFLGFRDDVPDLLAAADFFVLPSLAEGLPLSILEAMGQRLPVVASNVGGIPEVVKHGEHGLLVSPGDPGSLADAIDYVAGNQECQKEWGRAAAHSVHQNFSFEHVALEYEKTYLEARRRRR